MNTCSADTFHPQAFRHRAAGLVFCLDHGAEPDLKYLMGIVPDGCDGLPSIAHTAEGPENMIP